MAELSFLFASVQSDKPRPVTRLAYTQPRGAPGAGDFVRLSFKTGPQGRFLNRLPLGPGYGLLLLIAPFFLTATRQSGPSHSCLVLKTFCLVSPPRRGVTFCCWELSSQVQRFMEENFSRRFPAKALARSVI